MILIDYECQMMENAWIQPNDKRRTIIQRPWIFLELTMHLGPNILIKLLNNSDTLIFEMKVSILWLKKNYISKKIHLQEKRKQRTAKQNKTQTYALKYLILQLHFVEHTLTPSRIFLCVWSQVDTWISIIEVTRMTLVD